MLHGGSGSHCSAGQIDRFVKAQIPLKESPATPPSALALVATLRILISYQRRKRVLLCLQSINDMLEAKRILAGR